MTGFIRHAVGVLFLLALTTASLAADKAIIVLDASGSMWGQIDGKPKLEIARETLREVLQSLPADKELGLMAYGHREKGSCEDIELIVPPAAGTADEIIAAADSLKFLGKTPLSAAVKQAAEALKYTEDKATVILITDGLETCNADPCALGTELEESGVDFTAHVVGFGLTADEGKEVSCLADNTGGKYFQADDAEGLADALVEVVEEPAPAPEPEPAPAPEPKAEFNLVPSVTLSEGGPDLGRDDNVAWVVSKANADGSVGEYVSTDYGGQWKGSLEPGDYIVSAKKDHAELAQKVTIEDGKVATPHFVLNAGTLVVRPHASEGGGIESSAAVYIRYPGNGDYTYYGEMRAVVPAGDTVVNVKIGEGSVEQTVAVKAGEVVEKDIVVGVGRVVANAYYVEGMKVEDGGVFFEVQKATKKIDGTREAVSNGYGQDLGIDLPVGDYVLVARMDQATGEVPFTIKVGERVEPIVILNAGVLSITAPAGKFIQVFGAAKDIQGNRKAFGNTYAEAYQTTLPAGEYVVEVSRGDDNAKSEGAATVKAGERTELNVP